MDEREIDLDLLRYLTVKGSQYIVEEVEGAGIHPKTIIGLGTYLLDIDGDVDLLTGKQKNNYEKFLKPLLFDVPCQGVAGPGSCRGSGLIEPELLGKCYRDGEFRCRKCRETGAWESGNR